MAVSAEERAIRDAVAAHIRATKPNARVIHELVVGGCRADLAAVEPERITVFEIKSCKDTLDRLPNQVKQFTEATHETIVVADVKWFKPYDSGRPGYIPGPGLDMGYHRGLSLWRYPEPPADETYCGHRWRYETPSLHQPHAAKFLHLMWRSEMLDEAFRHHIAVSHRTNMTDMARLMAWHMTGREMARAVCRQLRMRKFPEADAPVQEQIAA